MSKTDERKIIIECSLIAGHQALCGITRGDDCSPAEQGAVAIFLHQLVLRWYDDMETKFGPERAKQWMESVLQGIQTNPIRIDAAQKAGAN